MEWEQQPAPIPNGTLLGVTQGGGKYVAVGADNAASAPADQAILLTSTDGNSWMRRSTGLPTIGDYGQHALWDVTFGNSLYCAVGGGYNSSFESISLFLVSSDCSDWTLTTSPGYGSYAVAYGNGRFVAVGGSNAYTSTNGTLWSKHEIPSSVSNVYDVAFGNGVFVGVGQFFGFPDMTWQILASSDGETWSVSDAPATDPQAISFGNDNFLLATAVNLVSEPSLILTSTDGEDWIEVASTPLAASLYAIAAGDDAAAAFGSLGDDPLLLSNEGGGWSEDDAPTLADICDPRGICKTDEGFMAVGATFVEAAERPLILTSTAAADGWGLVLS